MSLSRTPAGRAPAKTAIWDLLTFDRLLTAPVIHLIYWSGLGVIVLIAFFLIGAAVGTAVREGDIPGVLLAFGMIVASALVCGAMVLLWRALCEFYVAIFRISEDLRALREQAAPDAEPRGAGRPLV
jgi:hypothetical protein